MSTTCGNPVKGTDEQVTLRHIGIDDSGNVEELGIVDEAIRCDTKNPRRPRAPTVTQMSELKDCGLPLRVFTSCHGVPCSTPGNKIINNTVKLAQQMWNNVKGELKQFSDKAVSGGDVPFSFFNSKDRETKFKLNSSEENPDGIGTLLLYSWDRDGTVDGARLFVRGADGSMNCPTVIDIPLSVLATISNADVQKLFLSGKVK